MLLNLHSYMYKLHDAETCIEITGTEDRAVTDSMIAKYGYAKDAVISMKHWIAPSNEIATIAHEWNEDNEKPEWLKLGHSRRYIRRIVTYVYDSEYTKWAGQYAHAIRTMRLNVARLDPADVVDTCVHEIAHCFFHNNTNNPMLAEFVKVVMSDMHSIDYYSRARKLQGYKRRTPIRFVNEIHSILSALKHGLTHAQNLVQDESRTKDEIKYFGKYAEAFDILHPEKPTNKTWTAMKKQSMV